MLEEQRKRIDEIDDEIARLLKERFFVTEEVAIIKKKYDLPVKNSAREREIIERLTADLTDDMAKNIEVLFNMIFDLSRSQQTKMI